MPDSTVLIVCGIMLLLWGVVTLLSIYNSLISVKMNVANAKANIDVVLKQRYDEIPKLIQICEQYMSYEIEIIKEIMMARDRMIMGGSFREKMLATQDLSRSIRGLIALGESYPDLKANANFLQIQERLSDLEELLSDRREFYNSTVTLYNARIKQFPDVYFANQLSYYPEDHFKVAAYEKRSPSLKIKIPA